MIVKDLIISLLESDLNADVVVEVGDNKFNLSDSITTTYRNRDHVLQLDAGDDVLVMALGAEYPKPEE